MKLLEQLQGRYVLCAAGNGPYEQQVNRLREGKMLPYFSHLFISERVGYSKLAKEFFEYCLHVLGLAPDEVLMVGDSYGADICGAKACGLKTCYLGEPMPAADYAVATLQEIDTLL